MKKEIHPPYFAQAKITCACGNVMTVGSTVEGVKIDICSNCHPFYTGKQKSIEKGGRIERFQAKVAKAGKTAK